jgi:hypothetical protein
MRILCLLVLLVGCAARPTPASRPKSVQKANGLAVAGALAAPVAIVAGVALGEAAEPGEGAAIGYLAGLAVAVVAPSAGHWYAGRATTRGMALRAVGATAFTVGSVGALACLDDHDGAGDPFLCESEVILPLMILAGPILYVSGVVWDLVTADDAARAWNREHGLHLTPTIVHGAPGLAIGGRF